MTPLRALGAALLLGGALLGAPRELPAQGPATVNLSGRVTDGQGEPVAGARVVVRGAAARAAVTDGAGSYRVAPLPAGRYSVRAEAPGYRSAERSVSAMEAVKLDLVLAPAPIALAPLRVSAIRAGAGTTAATLPVKVDVVTEEEVRAQQALASNPTELLANVVPSFSPGRQKLTGAGESFRGRRPLFLVDGVPQSNPLRDGRRDGYTIDMDAIERIEVVFGANATQGLGATGGLVNYVTAGAPRSGVLEQRASLAATGNDGLEGNGVGWRAHYLAAKRLGSLDVLGSVSYERRGLQFDAEDRPIAIDNVQGDVADSWSRDFMGKLGWEPGAGQRLQLMVNDFRLAQRGRFDAVPGDRASGLPAVSVPGDPEGTEPINDVTTASLDYENADLAGGTLSAKAYWQEFSALFGGGRFDTFQDPAIAPVGEVFDQSENDSRKLGTRLTYARSGLLGAPLDLIAGFDLLRDRTFQRLVRTNRNWVPDTRFYNEAPFVQVDAPLLERLSLSAGLRWELAQLDVPGFTTLAGNRADFQPVEVAGGRPGVDRPLGNVGGVITPVAGQRI
jgi:iron complex outermembrane receptor protein